MGITKHDIKVLKQTSSQQFRLACILGFGLAILVFLTGAVNDIRLCHGFAAMAGLTVAGVFSTWIRGVSEFQASLQTVLLATQRLQMAVSRRLPIEWR